MINGKRLNTGLLNSDYSVVVHLVQERSYTTCQINSLDENSLSCQLQFDKKLNKTLQANITVLKLINITHFRCSDQNLKYI